MNNTEYKLEFGQFYQICDYWSRYMVIVVIASYEFPDENEMQFSFWYEMKNN